MYQYNGQKYRGNFTWIKNENTFYFLPDPALMAKMFQLLI